MNFTKDDAILLVEDDEVDVMKVRRAFKKIGIDNRLYHAGDGRHALEMLRATGEQALPVMPKIVLLDINMPRMNGIEFLREVRADEKFKQLIVFVLTTSSSHEDVTDAYALNVAGYIVKPVTFAKFLEAVQHLGKYWGINELPADTLA